ncbi:MAG: CBS domain-containing protein [Candidatus Micrarchaeia archaeon]
MMKRAFETVPDSFVTKVKFYDYKTPVTEAISSINSVGAAIVVKNKKYFGIVDDRSISRISARRLTDKFQIGKFARKLPAVTNDMSIEESIMAFYNTAAKALPYTEGSRMRGILKREKILSAMLSLHLLSDFKVEDAMSSPVVAIDASANIAQAQAAMRQGRINRLVVISGGRVFGLLTNKNLMSIIANPVERAPEMKSKLYSMSNTPVSSVCERNIYTVEYGTPIENAIREFLEHNISSLLVVRHGKPVGILTIRDVFEAFAINSTLRKNKIIISGLDDYTSEYKDEITDKMDDLANAVGRFTKVGVSYVSLHVKRSKARNYEMHGRIELAKKGSISASAAGYTLSEALDEIYDRLYKRAKEMKEIIVSYKKSGGGEYD